MPLRKQIAIYGVGLIGGSIGLALRGLNEFEVIGIGRSQQALDQALERGAIDRAEIDPVQAVANADAVIVATPVDQIVLHVRQVLEASPERCWVTDAGSTKREIVEALASDPRARHRFVGSHPMAGSERSGVAAADANLFLDRTVIVTPTNTTPAETLEKVLAFWKLLRARTIMLSPTEHDAAVARISHLPHALASVLAAGTALEELPLTAGGWSDSTRIASGDPGLWTEIFRQNRDALLAAIDAFDRRWHELREALEAHDWHRVSDLLREGKRRRDALGS